MVSMKMIHPSGSRPAQEPLRSKVKVWRSREVAGAELLRGDYVGHIYPWHSHEDVSLGVVMEGAVSLATRRQTGIAGPGSLVAVNSDEAHRGSAIGGGWRCRTIHLDPATIADVAQAIAQPGASPSMAVRSPAVQDPSLASDLLALHMRAEVDAAPLDQQSRAVALIATLLLRHGESAIELPGTREPEAVASARDYLQDHLAEKVSLEQLASHVKLPPFRLLRAFEKATGLSPHAFQTQARIRMAHALIRRDEALAQVAVATGFADQAHMTRVFKSIMGATPGQYRAAAR